MDSNSLVYKVVTICLRAALVIALAGAGLILYQRLPKNRSVSNEASKEFRETTLRIVLRRAPDGSVKSVPVELYSIDVSAAQREFLSERRAGQRFEEFLKQRMGGRVPTTQLDERGQTVIKVRPGKWWIHVIFPGTQELVWRLPVNVAGREQTVELTPENLYTRTKSF